MTESLTQLFLRELDRLKVEVSTYKNDELFWKTTDSISNSGGNLTIHLIGNLNHFIGAILGNTGYIRDRDGEFNNKNISINLILEDIDKTKQLIETVFSNLSSNDLKSKYPIEIRKKSITTEKFLIHLYGHLNYHLGQINYHRRLLA